MSILIAFVIGMMVTGTIALSVYLLDKAMDGSRTASVALFLVSSCVIAVLAISATEKDSERPCVQYETVMQYNAAVKTMMPVRYCAQYGEWVDGQED